MNTINTYKALSIVANVEQGNLIKRLIKENEHLKKVLSKKNLNECKSCMRWLKKDYFLGDECGDCFGKKRCIAEYGFEECWRIKKY